MMKTLKLGFLMLMVAALTFALGNSALALHDADTLKCMACHTIHASEDGTNKAVTPGNGFNAAPLGGVTQGGNPRLLLQPNVTDLCLTCHSATGTASTFSDTKGPAYHVMSGGTQSPALPGGDFLTSNTDLGSKGHNPYYTPSVAESEQIDPDGNIDVNADGTADPLVPPRGGVPPSPDPLARWDCVACHAPHAEDSRDPYGSAAAYRMLWTKPAGENPATGAGVIFTATSSTLTDPETDANTPVYTSGISPWCNQCHAGFHNTSAAGPWLIHPTEHGVGSGGTEYQGGYSHIVPVQTGTTVMCLSCHRAHAASTGAVANPPYDPATEYSLINNTKNMTRWNNESPSGADRGCNKCHDKGE